jgi:hypothetical protein
MIRPGMIGVNTARDDSPLLICHSHVGDGCDLDKFLVWVSPIGGGAWEPIPAADFWPLISKLNIGE